MLPVSRPPMAPMRQSHSADFESMKSSSMDASSGRLSSDGFDIFPVTGRASLTTTNGGTRSSWMKSNATMRVAFVLTCLQFSFAIYATFLLYWSSPAVPDLVVKPDVDYWLPKIGKFFPASSTTTTTQPGGGTGPIIPRMVLESGTAAVQGELLPPTKRAVCQSEQIVFEQKKSNDSNMIDIKTGLFRCVHRIPHPNYVQVAFLGRLFY